jgi:hypothetical protein
MYRCGCGQKCLGKLPARHVTDNRQGIGSSDKSESISHSRRIVISTIALWDELNYSVSYPSNMLIKRTSLILVFFC